MQKYWVCGIQMPNEIPGGGAGVVAGLSLNGGLDAGVG